jgi:hypothetical protein
MTILNVAAELFNPIGNIILCSLCHLRNNGGFHYSLIISYLILPTMASHVLSGASAHHTSSLNFQFIHDLLQSHNSNTEKQKSRAIYYHHVFILSKAFVLIKALFFTKRHCRFPSSIASFEESISRICCVFFRKNSSFLSVSSFCISKHDKQLKYLEDAVEL